MVRADALAESEQQDHATRFARAGKLLDKMKVGFAYERLIKLEDSDPALAAQFAATLPSNENFA